jgi:hypothetical protein
MTSNKVGVVIAICWSGTIPWRNGTSCGVTKNWFDDNPFASLEFAHNFMSWNERK